MRTRSAKFSRAQVRAAREDQRNRDGEQLGRLAARFERRASRCSRQGRPHMAAPLAGEAHRLRVLAFDLADRKTGLIRAR